MRTATLIAVSALTAACTDVTVQTDVAYDDRFDVAVLDIYRPAPAAVPRPAVITIHGGGWHTGVYRSSLAAIAERIADAGYVTLNIEYRLVGTGGEFPHAVQDCLCALAWTRAHAPELGIDPARIAGIGYSAGGHLVSMLGAAADVASVQPDCAAGTTGPFAAVVSGAGVEDMVDLADATPVREFLGGTIADVPQNYADASPLQHASAGDPPFLFVHGTSDYFVPIEHSRDMAAALRDVGTDARLLEVPGGGHIWNDSGGDWEVPLTSLDTPAAQAAVIDFLDETIGPVP